MAGGIAVDFILGQPWAMPLANVEELVAIAERTNEAPEAVAAKLGRKLDNARTVEVRDGVACIPVRGVIARYANLFTEISGATSVEILAKDFRTALDDPSVRGIVMDIDSPGGQAAGIGELAAMFRAGCDRKPVHAYVGNMAGSAAYWLAAGCETITCDPAAMLGSIGVVWPMRKPSEDRSAKDQIVFKSSQSPNKQANPETESGRDQWQSIVDATAQVFIDSVADYRKTTPEKVISDFGGGGLKVGRAAIDAGMADTIGCLESLIQQCSRDTMNPDYLKSRGGRVRDSRSSSFLASGPAAVASTETRTRGPSMKFPFSTVWNALMGSNPGADVELPEPASEESGTAPPPPLGGKGAAALPPLIPDIEAIKAEISKEFEAKAAARAKVERDLIFSDQGKEFVAAQVKAGRLIPADSAAYAAVFARLAEIDHSDPLATADGKPVKALDTFKASIEARPVSQHGKELVPSDAAAVAEHLRAGGFRVFDNQADPDANAVAARAALAEKQAARMLAGSEIGRAFLAESSAKTTK